MHQGFPDALLGFDNFPEQLTELRKPVSLRHWFIVKSTTREQPNGRDALSNVRGMAWGFPDRRGTWVREWKIPGGQEAKFRPGGQKELGIS